MMIDFKDIERNEEIEVGDLVKDRNGDIYLIAYNYNAMIAPYLLIDTSDCQVFTTYDGVEEISKDGYKLFKRKWEYKLTDN